jgi:hypothetical protein
MSKYAKSELDAQRELLDSLMGINRNKDQKDAIKDYRDDRVCKFFLTGMCPHDIFVNTKMDEGPCPKVHSEQLKDEFQKSGDVHMYDTLLQKEFAQRLSEADRVIKVRVYLSFWLFVSVALIVDCLSVLLFDCISLSSDIIRTTTSASPSPRGRRQTGRGNGPRTQSRNPPHPRRDVTCDCRFGESRCRW